jgi:hypothetical protein
LFHINPKRIRIHLKFDDHLTRQIVKGQMGVSREIRGMGICYICPLFTWWRLQQSSRSGGGHEFMDHSAVEITSSCEDMPRPCGSSILSTSFCDSLTLWSPSS